MAKKEKKQLPETRHIEMPIFVDKILNFFSGPEKDRPKSELDITFHDSYLLEAEQQKNFLVLAIDIDTHWFSGKPFGIIELKGIKNEKPALQNMQKRLNPKLEGWDASNTKLINSLTIIKTNGGLKLTINFAFDEGIELSCRSFTYKRADKYKDFSHAEFS